MQKVSIITQLMTREINTHHCPETFSFFLTCSVLLPPLPQPRFCSPSLSDSQLDTATATGRSISQLTSTELK